MKKKIIIFSFILYINLIPTLKADTLYLKNGRSIEGLVKKEEAGKVILDVGFGTVTFNTGEIAKIESSSPEDVRFIREKWERQKKETEERYLERKKELESARKRKELEPKEVGFIHDTGHIFVTALLNKKVSANLLLDTGATTVLLSKDIAKKLDITPNGENSQIINAQIADGSTVKALYVTLESISVEGLSAYNVGAVILLDESKTKNYDGLLGMSFLNNFNFQIDNLNKKLILQKRQDNSNLRIPLYFNNPPSLYPLEECILG